MIRYSRRPETVAFIAAVIGISCAAGGSMWLIWWIDGWTAAGIGAVLGACLLVLPIAVWQWRHDDQVARDVEDKLQAHRLSTRSFIQNRLQRGREQMEEWLRTEREQDAAAMLEAAKALGEALERGSELERRYKPFDWSRRLRSGGRFVKSERLLSSDEDGGGEGAA